MIREMNLFRWFGPVALAAAALVGVLMACPSMAVAEKCNPNDPETCVGGPTGKICGGRGEACCDSGPTVCGGDLECEGGTCIDRSPYRAVCKPPSNQSFNYWSTPSLAWTDAGWLCGFGNVAWVAPGWQ